MQQLTFLGPLCMCLCYWTVNANSSKALYLRR